MSLESRPPLPTGRFLTEKFFLQHQKQFIESALFVVAISSDYYWSFGQNYLPNKSKTSLELVVSRLALSRFDFSFSTFNYADQIKPLIQRTPTGRLSTVACFKTPFI